VAILDAISRDVRGAARSAVRRPGFSLLVVAILGLGIGASATILTIVYVLLVRPLPFNEADRLVLVRTRVGADTGKVALREYRALERDTRIFDGLAAYYPSQYNLTTSGGPPEALPSTISTANLFDVLGTTPIAGTTWPRAADFQRRFHVVLSHGLWRRAFGGDPALVGKTISSIAPATRWSASPRRMLTFRIVRKFSDRSRTTAATMIDGSRSSAG